ncbi:MAG: tRNA (adenosine(37)-N6)-threonylcarbamoyltransferase complex transferase subunit TsaD [Syntrophales bacterium]|nr:tRNA (adenosine(37)-N6)-threonylcarbamoyltransferase complex transferase subunit TsaD [Syntrophales bacterium]
MLVLGIESSCDETSAAVVSGGRVTLSNIVASQADFHALYGGVVPEIASRKHMEAIMPVIDMALDEAAVSLDDIEGIAVTRGPGLIGSILVGLSVAKSIAFARDIPFVGVNHIAGHIAAAFLTDDPPSFPFIALVVSGGHTNIYHLSDLDRTRLLGQTRDDAAGEAFDKAAKMLNLGYPGGVIIDKIAEGGDPDRVLFPRAMKKSLDFSFSGLKTSLLSYINKRDTPVSSEEMPHVAASFQQAIVDVLVEKTLRAAEEEAVSSIAISGGVAANRCLRRCFRKACEERGMALHVPPPVLCTDNAAMIAAYGTTLLRRGMRHSNDLNAVSRWPLGLDDV